MGRSYVATIHYGETPRNGQPIFYLAGPTDFRTEPNWHEQAADYLEKHRFKATLCLPTPRDGNWGDQGDPQLAARIAATQTRWQFDLQDAADVMVFWVPRPAFMTYVEFGAWCERHRAAQVAAYPAKHPAPQAVIGIHPDNPKADCLRIYAEEYDIPCDFTLDGTLELAIDAVNGR